MGDATVDPIDLRPTEALIEYVIANREKLDDGEEKACGFYDPIRSNLAVYFAQNGLVFTLHDLPHPVFACPEDLLHLPLKDARPP